MTVANRWLRALDPDLPVVFMSGPPQLSLNSPWLYGRGVDLLLGSGLGYLISVPFVAPLLLDPSGTSLLVLTLFVTLVVSGPHYGATLLRVYEARESRRRYALFAVHFTIALIGVAWLGSRIPVVGSLLLTLYVSWSPWHFAGQNYGVTLLQLRRQGLVIDPFEKRLLYLSYLLSFLLVLVVTHMGPSNATFAPEGLRAVVPVGSEGRGRALLDVYHVLRLGIPDGATQLLMPLLLAGYVGTTGRVVARFVGRAGWAAVLPGLAILSTQAMWFTVPALLQFFGVNASASLVFSALWTSAFHSLQYLWVTSYYARRSSAGFRLPSYLAKAALAGAALNTLPMLVLAPGLLGEVPFDAGLALLVFAVLNLHHFALDGAIWKLRDGQVARALLRGEAPLEGEPIAAKRSWLRGVVFAAGGIGAAAMLASEIEVRSFEQALRASEPDLARAEQALVRLHWMGRDSAWNYVLLGTREADRGNREAAVAAFGRSLAIQPNSEAWLRRGALHELDGDWSAALADYERALELDPDDPRTLERHAQAQRGVGRSKRKGRGR